MSPLYPDLASITEDYYDKVAAREPQGTVPAGDAVRHPHGGRRRREHHQRQHHRVAAARAAWSSCTGAPRPGSTRSPSGSPTAYGPKVRANCILPGAILTDIAEAWSPETRAGVGRPHAAEAGGRRRRLHRHRALARQRRVVLRHRRARPRRRRHVPPNLISSLRRIARATRTCVVRERLRVISRVTGLTPVRGVAYDPASWQTTRSWSGTSATVTSPRSRCAPARQRVRRRVPRRVPGRVAAGEDRRLARGRDEGRGQALLRGREPQEPAAGTSRRGQPRPPGTRSGSSRPS